VDGLRILLPKRRDRHRRPLPTEDYLFLLFIIFFFFIIIIIFIIVFITALAFIVAISSFALDLGLPPGHRTIAI
jgi:hypothetical protein